ncbi:hypothetical protein [Pontibacter indicus]|uniref:hypothetical protein n=1 Tax=Pontibacter indicus TaxID=1317125 RepID=UPI00147E8DF0|nr:hypothetical protein [Pontibacter indicus]
MGDAYNGSIPMLLQHPQVSAFLFVDPAENPPGGHAPGYLAFEVAFQLFRFRK